MWKVSGVSLNAGVLNNSCFNETVTQFSHVICADLRWKEFLEIVQKLNEAESDISNLSYHDRCNILNSNPVLVVRHFQYRVEVCFKLIIIDGPLGKSKYYAIRVELQIRGSPHVHSLIWVIGALKLTLHNVDEYNNWLENTISACLPDPKVDSTLYELVKTYQIHQHSKTCRRYKNDNCCFLFGRFFTDKTIVAKPLNSNLSDAKKKEILTERSNILKTVSDYINEYLNPSKHYFYDVQREDYIEAKSTEEILNMLDINVDAYYKSLEISDDNDFQIHLRQNPTSCFVNNYFKVSLEAWEANMGIQPVFNEKKAVAYICAYLSTSEDTCSNAMKQTLKVSIENKCSNYEQMKAIARTYFSN